MSCLTCAYEYGTSSVTLNNNHIKDAKVHVHVHEIQICKRKKLRFACNDNSAYTGNRKTRLTLRSALRITNDFMIGFDWIFTNKTLNISNDTWGLKPKEIVQYIIHY